VDRTPLLLRCPKCDVVRQAGIATCPNCGLTIKLENRAMIVATDGPPPGGAAVA
jgi:RNA polymerase subunit RPABC4/transcription elongation factor Spt4